MITHKNLLLATQALIEAHPEIRTPELTKIVAQSEEFLVSSKTFEYTGVIELKYAATIKLPNVETDLDDVIRAMAGKRTDIAFPGYLCVVKLPEPEPEITEAEVT